MNKKFTIVGAIIIVIILVALFLIFNPSSNTSTNRTSQPASDFKF